MQAKSLAETMEDPTAAFMHFARTGKRNAPHRARAPPTAPTAAATPAMHAGRKAATAAVLEAWGGGEEEEQLVYAQQGEAPRRAQPGQGAGAEQGGALSFWPEGGGVYTGGGAPPGGRPSSAGGGEGLRPGSPSHAYAVGSLPSWARQQWVRQRPLSAGYQVS